MTFEVPYTDVLSFAFDSPCQVDDHKPLYIDAENPDRTVNKHQARSLTKNFIAGFQYEGLQDGDCVLVVLFNNIFYSSLYFGIIGAGGVYQGTNPKSSVFELGHLIELTTPKIILTCRDALGNVQEAAAARDYLPSQIFLFDSKTFPLPGQMPRPPTPPLSDLGLCLDEQAALPRDVIELLDHGEADWVRFDDEVRAKSTVATMFSTSGTSGLPKSALNSHFAVISQHLSTETRPPYDVVRLMCLPFFHVFAALFVHIFPVRLGQQVYIMERFEAVKYATAIQTYSITDTFAAPPMIHALVKSSLPLKELLKTIRYFGIGGAPIKSAEMREFEKRLDPSATCCQVWGLTEIGAATLLQYPERNGCDGSIGKPQPGYEMRLIDPSGNVITNDDQQGETQVRYEGNMLGYKGQPRQVTGQWYSTGDVMTRIGDRYFVVGRSKELIKVNGFQVAPAEIESVLMSHPCIVDAAVIGCAKDDNVTEVPRAYIVRATDESGRCSKLTVDEVYTFARKHLASYKALNGGIVFVEAIPRTPSGKIQRFKLASMDQYRRKINNMFVCDTPTGREGADVGLFAKTDREADMTGSARSPSSILHPRRSPRIAKSQQQYHARVGSHPPIAASYARGKPATSNTRIRPRSRVSLIAKLAALKEART